jgi:hypothetical protein
VGSNPARFIDPDSSMLNSSAQQAYSLALKCTLAHEESHVIDLPLCKCGTDYPAQFATKGQRASSECKAAHVELECLEKSKQACNGNADCINWLEKFKVGPQGLAQQFGCK